MTTDAELDAIDEMSVEDIRKHVMTPNRCWSDAYCDCVQQRAAERMLAHYDRLRKKLDDLGVAIADAGYTWTPAMREAYERRKP